MTAVTWQNGEIPDCILTPFRKFADQRGWLAEVFRQDETPEAVFPAMGYLSQTLPDVVRGPHEHVDQTDLFIFFDGLFEVRLWDYRPNSPTFGIRQVLELGQDTPATLFVPPGVVHGYRNKSGRSALIFNCPNRLYAGWHKQEAVDEIRHEDEPDSPFQFAE